jgi:hypothetical protein
MDNNNFYKNSKLYKIVDNTNDNIYIGATTKKLCQRLAQHMTDYRKYLNGKITLITCFDIFKNNNYEIILLEEFPCDNIEQLNKRKRYYIETLECINKIIPFKSVEEKKERINNYNEINKNKIAEKNKIYIENNKEKIAETQKIYRDKNKDKIIIYRNENKERINNKKRESYKQNKIKCAEKSKIYREANKEKIAIQRKEYNQRKRNEKLLKQNETK